MRRQLQLVLPVGVIAKPGAKEEQLEQESIACIRASRSVLKYLEREFRGYSCLDGGGFSGVLEGVWIEKVEDQYLSYKDRGCLVLVELPDDSPDEIMTRIEAVRGIIHEEYKNAGAEQVTVYVGLQEGRWTRFWPPPSATEPPSAAVAEASDDL